jgi:hypothetical protein
MKSILIIIWISIILLFQLLFICQWWPRWHFRVLRTAPITAPYFDETSGICAIVSVVDTRIVFPGTIETVCFAVPRWETSPLFPEWRSDTLFDMFGRGSWSNIPLSTRCKQRRTYPMRSSERHIISLTGHTPHRKSLRYTSRGRSKQNSSLYYGLSACN